MKLFTRTPKTLESFTTADGSRWAALADDTHTRNGSPVTFAEYLTAARAAEWAGITIRLH